MDIDLLLTYIPYFETVDPDVVCKWHGGVKRDNGGFTVHYAIYDEKLYDFIKDVYDSGIMVNDYRNELNRLIPNWQTVDIQEVVKTAEIYKLRVIFTKCIRVDRFNEGSLGEDAKSGFLLAILKRMQELHKNTPENT